MFQLIWPVFLFAQASSIALIIHERLLNSSEELFSKDILFLTPCLGAGFRSSTTISYWLEV